MSKSQYFFDKEKRIISKGMSSIKYMSDGLSDELYDLAHSRDFPRFVDILAALENTSINSRQLDILIKVDFFSAYGNQRELLRITELYTGLFNHGCAKQVPKAMVDGTPLESVVRRYAVGVTKSGGEAKKYTLLDVPAILRGTEDVIKTLHFSDLPDTVKVKNFESYMGYAGYVSGKAEDRRKLYIVDIFPCLRRKDKVQFGYNVLTRSIGSGIEGRFTVLNRVYNKTPIQKGDVIFCSEWHRDGPYFRMTDYFKLQ